MTLYYELSNFTTVLKDLNFCYFPDFCILLIFQAGIPGENLTLAFESEVAAVYCRMLPKKSLVGLRGRDLLQSFNKGRKFMVLDLGGGFSIQIFKNRIERGLE